MWVSGSQKINNAEWKYQMDDNGAVIHYESACGKKLEKKASNAQIMELHGCLANNNDNFMVETICLGIIDEASIVPLETLKSV